MNRLALLIGFGALLLGAPSHAVETLTGTYEGTLRCTGTTAGAAACGSWTRWRGVAGTGNG